MAPFLTTAILSQWRIVERRWAIVIEVNLLRRMISSRDAWTTCEGSGGGASEILHPYIYIYICIYIFTHANILLYIYMNLLSRMISSSHACTTCVRAGGDWSEYISISIYLSIHIYIYIYTYVYIHKREIYIWG